VEVPLEFENYKKIRIEKLELKNCPSRINVVVNPFCKSIFFKQELTKFVVFLSKFNFLKNI
jgi:hypothetical protein